LSFRSAAEESASALVSEIGPGFSPDTTHTRKSGLQPRGYALRSLHHKTRVPHSSPPHRDDWGTDFRSSSGLWRLLKKSALLKGTASAVP
jgi:hypothetical protein